MRSRSLFIVLVTATLLAGGTWLVRCLRPLQKPSLSVESGYVEQAGQAVSEPIQPLETVRGIDPRKVALGERLFRETRLSRNDTIACATCHDVQKGGTDGRDHSEGIFHRKGQRNAPTVFNCSLNYRQFWDGRAPSLEAQVDGPLQAAAEMASRWPDVVAKLRHDPVYVSAFAALYREGIQPETVRNAIATYERSLITPDSRFDQFLRGNSKALSAREVAGYQRFKSYGCVSCHQGANVGGNIMQPFGAMADPATFHVEKQSVDWIRFELTESDVKADHPVPLYKVPSLRNIARTGPYFHDGSVRALSDAVAIMGYSQLGRPLSREDTSLIVAFLQTLTGTYQGKGL